MTRTKDATDNKYHIEGKKFPVLKGTRAKVWHGTAYETTGGLTKKDLFKNKAGRIVSKSKHVTEKAAQRLVKAGYGTKKGKFGYVKLDTKSAKTKSRRRRERRKQLSRKRG